MKLMAEYAPSKFAEVRLLSVNLPNVTVETVDGRKVFEQDPRHECVDCELRNDVFYCCRGTLPAEKVIAVLDDAEPVPCNHPAIHVTKDGWICAVCGKKIGG